MGSYSVPDTSHLIHEPRACFIGVTWCCKRSPVWHVRVYTLFFLNCVEQGEKGSLIQAWRSSMCVQSEHHTWRIPSAHTWHPWHLAQLLPREDLHSVAWLCSQHRGHHTTGPICPGDHDEYQCPGGDFAQRQVKRDGLSWAICFEVLLEVCRIFHHPPAASCKSSSPPAYPTVVCPTHRNLTFAEVSPTLLVVKESHTITFPS